VSERYGFPVGTGGATKIHILKRLTDGVATGDWSGTSYCGREIDWKKEWGGKPGDVVNLSLYQVCGRCRKIHG
jgi:hypothetical protein